MSVPAPDENKAKLLGLLHDAQSSNSSLKQAAQYIVERADYAEGMARHLIPVIKSVKDDSGLPSQLWADLSGAWAAQDRDNKFLLAGIDVSSSSATTASASLTTTATAQVLTARMPTSTELATLRAHLKRPGRVERVRGLIRAFGLDLARTGSRSPLELLDEASSALNRPAATAPGSTSVLVSARSSIEQALGDLLQRRPTQEVAKKGDAKVVSIGRQCSRTGLDVDHFERLGHSVVRLLDDLSRAKTAYLSQAEVEVLFDNALQFFDAFLDSLDVTKLRP